MHDKPGQTDSKVASACPGLTVWLYRKDIEKEVSLSELEKLTSTTVVYAEKKNVINAEKWKEI